MKKIHRYFDDEMVFIQTLKYDAWIFIFGLFPVNQEYYKTENDLICGVY